MGDCEPDCASGPDGFLALAFETAAGGCGPLVEAALASAFAPSPGSPAADGSGEQAPACWVVVPAHRHLNVIVVGLFGVVKGLGEVEVEPAARANLIKVLPDAGNFVEWVEDCPSEDGAFPWSDGGDQG